MMTDPNAPISEAAFRRLPREQQHAIMLDVTHGARATETRRRNSSTAAQAARARYAASTKGKVARHAAYLRDKARRLAALERESTARDPLFGR